jgi:CRP-like cAMP-binding protein
VQHATLDGVARTRIAGSPRSGRDGARRRPEAVRLLDVEPEIGVGLPEAERQIARRHVVVPSVRIPTGKWTPPRGLTSAFGVMVISGMLVSSAEVAGVADVQVFGPGDLFDAALLARPRSAWQVLQPAHVAALGGQLILAAGRWPQLVSGLTRRLFDGHHQQHGLALMRALPRVEDRVVALLAQLGSRWGRVTPAGVLVTLPVTHEVLGHLVAARRPTVSLALTALRDQGRLDRLGDGRWLLTHEDARRWAGGTLSGVAAPDSG